MSTSQKVDILLLGAGGREHAILAKLAESPRAGKLYVAPGNGGMYGLATKVELDAEDPVAVAGWAREHAIGLVVIGPEAPLVAGVADAVRSAGIPCFGPNGEAAQMEGSKKFAKHRRLPQLHRRGRVRGLRPPGRRPHRRQGRRAGGR